MFKQTKLLISFLLCLISVFGWGDTHEAASASYADVLTAYTAASNGDTVTVPSGTETWGTTLVVTKGLYIIGNGVGNTIITNGVGGSNYIIEYKPADYAANYLFQLIGFEFDADGAKTLELGHNSKSAPFTQQTKIRIHHNEFTNSGNDVKGQAIWNNGTCWGVVDHNTFDGVDYPIANSFGIGDDSWWANESQSTFAHGSASYLYYEDNTFLNMSAYGGGADNILMDGEYSPRYVFRYNTVTNTVPSYSLLDVHGEQETPMQSCFGVEAYGNQITHGANYMTFFKQRSGQALIFLNNATTSTQPENEAYTSGSCICPPTYTALKVTHNTYWWGNRKNLTGVFWDSVAGGGLDSCDGKDDIPTLGRDVFSDGSTPGITSGTLGNLPGTCSVGQGYWATDQSTADLTGMVGVNPSTPISGTLYICEVEDEWVEYYTPYTYPHPYVSGGVEIVRYVDPDSAAGGNGTTWVLAYDSLFDWEAAEDGNALDGNWMHCYVRASSGTADTTAVVIAGWDQALAADYILIEAASTDRADADGWDAAKYQLEVTDNVALDIYEDYVRFDGLQIQNKYSAAGDKAAIYMSGQGAGATFHISNCRIKGTVNASANGFGIRCKDADSTTHIYNTIISEEDSYGIYVDAGIVNVYNSDMYKMSVGIRRVAGTVTVKNSAIFKTDDDFLGTITVDYCASDDNDGTNNVAESGGGVDWPNDFTDAANGDFTLVVGSNLINAGTNDPSGSGYGDPDINGTARATWDVGAYEYPVIEEKFGAQYKKIPDDYGVLRFGLILSFFLNLLCMFIIYKLYQKVRMLHTQLKTINIELKMISDIDYLESIRDLNKYLEEG